MESMGWSVFSRKLKKRRAFWWIKNQWFPEKDSWVDSASGTVQMPFLWTEVPGSGLWKYVRARERFLLFRWKIPLGSSGWFSHSRPSRPNKKAHDCTNQRTIIGFVMPVVGVEPTRVISTRDFEFLSASSIWCHPVISSDIWFPLCKGKIHASTNNNLKYPRFFDAFFLYSVFSVWTAQMEIGGMFRRDAGKTLLCLGTKRKESQG